MAGFLLELDPVSEDAANTALDINDGTVFRAFSPLEVPPPERDSSWASSADTEGELLVAHRYRNREITIGLRVYGTSAANLTTKLGDLHKKVAKLNRQGGTLKVTTPAVNVRVFDILGAQTTVLHDSSYMANFRAVVELRLEAEPFARGAETSGTDKAETTLPAAIQIDTGPAGDELALGRLKIDEDDADNQAWVIWGIESQNFDATDPSTKKLFYEAEDLYATGGAAAAAGSASPSGSAANKVVTSAGLINYYTQVVSMKASTVAGSANGSGSYPAHLGTFQVFARIRVPLNADGDISIRLEWGEGDFSRFTENDPYVQEADSPLEGEWVLVDLGQVNLTKVIQGTQQWDGRIACASTVDGDTVSLDYLILVPVAEGSGQAFAVSRVASSSVGVTARDSFDTHTISTSLIGKTPPVVPSGVWTEAGDVDDYTIAWPDPESNFDYVAQRTAVSDSSNVNGNYARCGGGTATNTVVSCEVSTGDPPNTTTEERWCGVFARYTDTSNWLFGGTKLAKDSKGRYSRGVVYKRTTAAGLVTLGQEDKNYYTGSPEQAVTSLSVDTAGRVTLSWGDALLITAQHADLATGGTLASGGYGIYDVNTTTQVVNRNYNNFVVQASAVTTDAALYASQSLEVRSDRVVREDSAGTVWLPPGRYEGDYAFVPPAGNEGRSYRWIVKASRGQPGVEPDSGIDNISARLHSTPRYLVVGD